MNYSAPGVYIKYVTDGPLLVRAASTSTAVFIGNTIIGSGTSGTDVTPIKVSDLTEYSDQFSTKGARSGIVCMPTTSNTAVDHMGHTVRGFFLNGGKHAYIVSLNTTGQAAASVVLNAENAGDNLYEISATSDGLWGNDVAITATTSSLGAGFVDISLELTITDGTDSSVISENFLGLNVTELESVSSNLVSFASTVNAATLSVDTATPADTDTANLAGGLNAPVGAATMSDVYAALADIDDISLIALPGKNWPDNQSDYEHAIAHCQAKKDRMVLIQLRDDTTDFENISVPKDKYTTVYYPSATVSLQVGGGNTITQTVNTTGHVTGVFARTDSTKGAWTAPAGMHANIAGITQLTKDISQTKQESINPHGTNALRYIEGIPVVWGAHTRDDGIYTQVPVMRTAFLIADSLRDTLNRVVFAKNTEVLWSNVKAGVSGFMDTLFIQGAFQGATPAQAFEVAVGLGESMTQTDIDGGLLRVTVRFRPAKFAEFIEVSVEQLFDNAA